MRNAKCKMQSVKPLDERIVVIYHEGTMNQSISHNPLTIIPYPDFASGLRTGYY